jgi:hypothetical protein
MDISEASRGALALSAFLVPVLTYFYFARKPSKQTAGAGPLPPPTEITNIFIHPIKSCHGLAVKEAKLLPTGLDLGMSSPMLVDLIAVFNSFDCCT